MELYDEREEVSSRPGEGAQNFSGGPERIPRQLYFDLLTQLFQLFNTEEYQHLQTGIRIFLFIMYMSTLALL
jgi:hypothetical protein